MTTTSIEEVAGISAESARQLTDRIKVAVEGTWQLIAEAYQSGAHLVLGYSTWDDYCTREFGTARLKLPHEERMGTVKSLRQAGLSLRAISAATGNSVNTIRADLSGQVYQTDTPEDVPAGVVDVGTGEFVDAGDLGADPAPASPAPKVTGIDGKTYKAAPAARAPHRKPLTDSAHVAGQGLRDAMEKVERLFDDDRYRQNAEQVALALRGHLSYVAETVAAVLDQLP